MPNPKLTPSEIIADIRRLARELGRQPNSEDYRERGRYAHTAPARAFGSWRAAVEAAGLRFKDTRRTPARTEAEIERDLRRVARRLGHPPSLAEYAEFGQYHYQTLTKRAGGRWDQALVKYLRLDQDHAHAATQKARGLRTTAERLAEVRALAKRLRHVPTATEARRHGIATVELLRRVGAWEEVLNAAGLGRAVGVEIDAGYCEVIVRRLREALPDLSPHLR